MRLKMLLGIALLVPVLAALPARADFSCTIAGSSADSPHLTDPPDDYNGIVNGIVNGNGSGLVGDVNRGSGDILEAWIAGAGTKYAVHVQVGSIGDPATGSDLNETVTFLFDNQASKLPVKREYVQASLSGRGTATYSYGSFAPDPTTNVNTYTQAGSTTGTVTAGTPGEIAITLPWRQLGQPAAGDVIGNPLASTEFTIGTQQTGGLLEPVDDTSNGDGCTDGITY